MQENLRICRDAWWAMPSGSNYVTDENQSFSSHGHGLHKSLNSDDAEYIQFHGAGTSSYYGRLQSSNLDLTHVLMNVRAEAAVSGDATLYINSYEIGSIDHIETKSTQSKLIPLNWEQKERILQGRTQENYDFFNFNFSTPVDEGIQTKKLYDLEVFYSGDSTWDNYDSGFVEIEEETLLTSDLSYPEGNTWLGHYKTVEYTEDEYDFYFLLHQYIFTGTDQKDDSYIELTNPGGTHATWFSVMPSGYLSLYFNPSGIDPGTQITRAQLNLRMALPPSGEYENAPDTYEINGYNPYYKDKGHTRDLEYIDFNEDDLDKYYFVYGKGGIIEEEGFKDYTTELNFLDPSLPSGDIDSVKHRNVDMLANTEFQIVGMPSGTLVSFAELVIQYTPNNMLGLYTVGDSYRCPASSTVDVGTDDSYLRGDGGWHHRGWRYGVPFEEEIFDNFYTFSESEGRKTYPEEIYEPGYSRDIDTTVYGEYTSRSPEHSTVSSDPRPILKEPIRYEYYRNNLLLEGINDYGEYYEYPSPSYYRTMIYNGDTLASFDSENPYNSSLSLDIGQIYFGERLPIGYKFTLYFMLYRTYFERSYGVFFQHGPLYKNFVQTDRNEILCYTYDNRVGFNVKGSTGGSTAYVDIKKNSVEPILVVCNCDYDFDTEQTTIGLYVHDDIKNYFLKDWLYDIKTFSGFRHQDYRSKTVLGTLSHDDYYRHLTNNRYLNHVSFCEFGYANQSLELNPYTSSVTQSTGYDNSTTKTEYFLASRLCNGLYLNPNASGIQWKVPYGSGTAEWSTDYSIDEWTNNDTQYELFNPVGRGGTNEWIHPSAIYIDLETTHNTDHPSGVTVYADVEFDSGSNENWKVGHVEFNIPSGTTTHNISGLTKYINMEDGPIKYSDVQDINLRLTTKYVDAGNYYGDLVINSVNVVFDSYCVAATGFNDLDLYTSGGSVSYNNDLDLFVEGSILNNGELDLYTHGVGHLASGDMTLYTISDNYVIPEPPDYDVSRTQLNLYIEGLDPPKDSGNVSLYTWATAEGVGGIRSDMPLYTYCQYDRRYTLPLFMDGGTGDLSARMNLYVENIIDSSNNDMTLFTVGPSGYNESVNLYIRGLGESDGYYPANESMNLFMARDSECVAHRMSLYLAQKTVTEMADLFIEGAEIQSSSVPLYIYGSGLPTNNDIDLYTHGF